MPPIPPIPPEPPPLYSFIGNYNNYLQDSNDYSTNFNAETSNCEKTVHETSLPESDFISRNPLIGNNFVAIKNSVVKCVPLVEVIPPIADLADKLLLLDINSL